VSELWRPPVAERAAHLVDHFSHAAMYAPHAAFLSELFGTRVCYSGGSLGWRTCFGRRRHRRSEDIHDAIADIRHCAQGRKVPAVTNPPA
jgi:hypothetical protein